MSATHQPDGPIDPAVSEQLARMSAQMDAEVRGEQAEYEAMALRAAWRARGLVDVAREWMLRGDTVEVRAGGQALAGTITAVGTDVLVLATPMRPTIVVPLGGVLPLLRQVEARPEASQPEGAGPRTLVAWLSAAEMAGERVVVVLDDGHQVEGLVLAVAADHVLLGSRQGRQAVPTSRVTLAWPST